MWLSEETLGRVKNNMIFKDRQDAGQKLIQKLEKFKNSQETIVLGLPRGGVVTAFEISKELNLPLDIIVTRKIGAPGNPELAIGAITEIGESVLDVALISTMRVSQDYVNQEIKQETKEANRRLSVYRGTRPPLNLQDKRVILVDDGVATGYTMLAAIKSVRKKEAKEIIIAVPVIALDTLKKIKREADEVIYLDSPISFWGISSFYENFDQIEDEEVIALMKSKKI
jgi:predicted phosphoribosyltransferase